MKMVNEEKQTVEKLEEDDNGEQKFPKLVWETLRKLEALKKSLWYHMKFWWKMISLIDSVTIQVYIY